MRKLIYVGIVPALFVAGYAIGDSINPSIQIQESGIGGGGAASSAYTGTCAAGETIFDSNGMQKCAPATDAVPNPLYVRGAPALPSAVTNTKGGVLNLCGGSGVDRAVVVAATSDPAETFTVTVNGTLNTFTDNSTPGANQFASTGTDAQLATDIAALVDALTGVEATANSPTSGTVYIKPDANEPGACAIVLGGTNGATITAGEEGNIVLFPGVANNSFGNLIWGVVGTSYPGFRRSSASLMLQLADMSTGTYMEVGGSNQGLYLNSTGSRIHAPNNGGMTWSSTTSGSANDAGCWLNANGSTTGVNFALGAAATTGCEVTIQSNKLTTATMTLVRSGAQRDGVSEYAWTNAMVTALGATTTGDIKVTTLPAKTQVRDVAMVVDTQCASITDLKAAVGRTSALYIDYIVSSDIDVAANTFYGDASAERGTNLTLYDMPSYTATTDVYMHLISAPENLSEVTACTGRVILTTVTLP